MLGWGAPGARYFPTMHHGTRLNAKNTAMKMAHTLVSGLFRQHVPPLPLPRGRFIDGGKTETY